MGYPTGVVPAYGAPLSPGLVQRPLSVPRSGTEFIPSLATRSTGTTGATAYLPTEVHQLQFTLPPASFVGRDPSNLIEHRFI